MAFGMGEDLFVHGALPAVSAECGLANSLRRPRFHSPVGWSELLRRVEARLTKPVRVLHVVGAMNRGGVETWLLHVLRNIGRERFTFDFLVHTREHCAYDEELRALGA